MNEPIKIYSYSTNRNKFTTENKTASTLKRELQKERGNFCYVCKNSFQRLQLEHFIPVMTGGHLFNKSNCFLICGRCHIPKTIIDKKVIKIMKELKIIKGNYQIFSYYPIDEVQKFYIQIRDILLKTTEAEKIYNFGSIGEDYIQICQDMNRLI